VYILQFEKPLGNLKHQAQFYIGWCIDGQLSSRLEEHRAGRGAAITRACNERGIAFDVVATMPGGRDRERQLKRRKNTRQIVERYTRGTLRL
jgi:predicted GIY-YIG superfamily endonuclease